MYSFYEMAKIYWKPKITISKMNTFNQNQV